MERTQERSGINWGLIGLLVLGFIFFMAFSTKMATRVKPISRTELKPVKMIYAGKPVGSRYYDEAEAGTMKPFGGKGTLQELIEGNPNCNYVLVRYNLIDGYNDATLDGTVDGLLSFKRINCDNTQFTEINKDNGAVLGASTGWFSIKVGPGMSDKDLMTKVGNAFN